MSDLLESPSILVTVLAFLLLLGPLVVVHELGHYLVARLFKVKVDAFSVGFGKELLGRTDRQGTRWKLSALPLGGYVQFAGDANAASMPAAEQEDVSPEERGKMFHHKPLWQRSLIVLAGPATNFLFAIMVFAGFFMAYGERVAEPVVGQVLAGSPAQAAGLRSGDRILAIDGEAIGEFSDIVKRVMLYPGRSIDVDLQRGERRIAVKLKIAERAEKDRFGNTARRGVIGISQMPVSRPVGPIAAIGLGYRESVDAIGVMVAALQQIFIGERSVKELGGPIKIAQYSGEAMTLGWREFVSFAAFISINLAFINVLPIPGLDGGHLAFYAAEAVRRKPLGQRSQEMAFRMGLALVLGLMVFVTINDIAGLRLFDSQAVENRD
jgi:regulator of sigma E protease